MALDGRVLHWNGRELVPTQELTDLKILGIVVAQFSVLFRVPEIGNTTPDYPGSDPRTGVSQLRTPAIKSSKGVHSPRFVATHLAESERSLPTEVRRCGLMTPSFP
jgi:hypothetical protein